jgi:hypothetical protein
MNFCCTFGPQQREDANETDPIASVHGGTSNRWTACHSARSLTCLIALVASTVVFGLCIPLLRDRGTFVAWNELTCIPFFLLASVLDRVRRSQICFQHFFIFSALLHLGECVVFMARVWSPRHPEPFAWNSREPHDLNLVFGTRILVLPWIYIRLMSAVGMSVELVLGLGTCMAISSCIGLIAWCHYVYAGGYQFILASIGIFVAFCCCSLQVSLQKFPEFCNPNNERNNQIPFL